MGDPEEPVAVLSLCTGGDGLDIGFALAVPGARPVCRVEWEAFAVSELVRRMESGELHPSPVWTDLRTFDGKPFCGGVDVLLAGYPCQPFSTAGKRAGADDPRHLWPHVRRVAEEVRPPVVFLENVSGHLSLGFREVAEDLEGLGYEVAAGLFTAAEVGASHRRERLFILGVDAVGLADGVFLGRGQRSGQSDAEAFGAEIGESGGQQPAHGRNADVGVARGVEHSPGHDEHGHVGRCESGRGSEGPVGGASPVMGHADGARPDAHATAGGPRGAVGESGGPVGDAHGAERRGRDGLPRHLAAAAGPEHDGSGDGQAVPEPAGLQGREHDAGQRAAQCRRDPLPLFPPGPRDPAWADILAAAPELAPATEPGVCGVVDGLAAVRAPWLRLLGNGVCPLQAAYAFCTLWAAVTLTPGDRP